MPVIIDFHAHILPGIDDGSKNIAASLEMLHQEVLQGVDIVVATPHFYASSTTLTQFLSARDSSYRRLKKSLPASSPSIYLGAEVALFPGLDTAESIEALCIEHSNAMLVEMPFSQWSKGEVQVINNLLARGIVPIIAHIERYMKYQRDKALFHQIINSPVYVQVNAEALASWHDRRKVLHLFRGEYAHLLGSDCHNTSGRAPNLKQGREMIRKKLGYQQLDLIDEIGCSILNL